MFKRLLSIFSAEKLVDNISEGVDKLYLSKEEQLDAHKELLKLYAPFKIAQRILAIMFTSVYLFIHLVTAILHTVYVVKGWAVEAVLELYRWNNEELGTVVLVVMGFYFSGGVVSTFLDRSKSKK